MAECEIITGIGCIVRHCNTVDREIFAVKIFSDSMASPKIKHTKIIHIINDSVVRGHLSENYLARKFIARNINFVARNIRELW